MSGSKRALGQALLMMMTMLTSAAERSTTSDSHVDRTAEQNHSVQGNSFFGGWKEMIPLMFGGWKDARALNISEARFSAVKTLVDRFDGAQETPAGRPMIARKEFTVADRTSPVVKQVTVPANSTGYVQEITADGFVKCDFDGLTGVVRLSAEDAVDAGLEVRSKLHRAVHGDDTSRPQHRAHGLDCNSLALKNAPFVKSAITEPLRIARDVHNGKLGCCSGRSAARCVTKSIVPLAGEVATAATLFGTGGGSAPIMAARGISAAAAVGGVANDIIVNKGKPSYSTAQSIVGAYSPGVSTCMSFAKNTHNVGSQIHRAINDPSAPGVDIRDVGRLAVDGVAVARFANRQRDWLEGIDEEGLESGAQGHNGADEVAPAEAVAGGSTLDPSFDHQIDYSKGFCNVEDGQRCTLDDALALCRDHGELIIMTELHNEGYHCPVAAPRGDGKYDCMCFDYGEDNQAPSGAPKTVTIGELAVLRHDSLMVLKNTYTARQAAKVDAMATTLEPTPAPTTAAAETGADGPNDVYVQKEDYGNGDWRPNLPTNINEAAIMNHLNEIQQATETSKASLWQKFTGTEPRQPAQEFSSCDNVATSSNCGPEGRPIELVIHRLELDTDFSQIDALLPRIKQFTFVKSGVSKSQTCEHRAQHEAKSSMKFMAEKYPGIPMRMLCVALDGEIQSGAADFKYYTTY